MPVLNLRITSNNQVIKLSGNIIAQDLILHQACVHFANTTSLPKAVDIEVPFVSRFQVHNSGAGNAHLTLPVDVEKRTTISYPDLKFATENIPSDFVVRVFNEDGETAATFDEIQLWFNYTQTALF